MRALLGDEVALSSIASFMDQACAALSLARREHGLAEGALPGGAEGLSIQRGRIVRLAIDEVVDGSPVATSVPEDDLWALLHDAARTRPELRAWIDQHERPARSA